MKKIFTLVLAYLLFVSSIHFACTTAVVSGEATVDGRPLLLKNRDTSFLDNRLVYFTDGKYDYIGLVNSEDEENEQVWVGFNSAGFGIMNSASYNLKSEEDTTKLKDKEGVLMKQALQECATLEDFEELLLSMEKPLGVEANFGVIDAQGGAAYYETNNFRFYKYDATNPKVAPNGYLIRTNFSFAGKVNGGYGYIRYESAKKILEKDLNSGGVSLETLLQKVPRNLSHSLTGVDLKDKMPENIEDTTFVSFQDFIPRYWNSSVSVVQGVKKGESAEFTTMWSTAGFSLSSVAVPVWLNSNKKLPSVLIGNDEGNAPLCNKALELKAEMFPVERGSGNKYINLAQVINEEETGILQKLKPVENDIIFKGKKYLDRWRNEGVDEKEMFEFYDWADQKILKDYQKLFGI